MEDFLKSVAPILAIILLFAKAYHDHMTIKQLKISDEDKDDRIKYLEEENLKMTEALERTYASKEFLYKFFMSRETFEEKISHLEDTLKLKMDHINKSIKDVLTSIKEGKKDAK